MARRPSSRLGVIAAWWPTIWARRWLYMTSAGNRVGKCNSTATGPCAGVRGQAPDCPFRYQGQYEDVETGLYYNRFRYYDPEAGQYISQDPIRLAGGIKLYSYVHNTNSWVDELGLAGLPGVDFAGHPDLFPATGNQRNIVTIKMQGRRGLDFTQAHNEAQITRAQAKGYTWHHLNDFDPATGETTMQLIKTDTHIESFPHKGSAGQFADQFGVKYDSKEAIEVSKQQGWHSSCS